MTAGRQFRPGRDAIALALAAVALLAWDASGLDMAVSLGFGDARGFGWRHHPFTQGVLHDGGRWLSAALLAFGLWQVLGHHPPPRPPHRWAAVIGLLLCLLLVPALKQWSPTSCPYELAQFGGQARWLSHWRLATPDGGPGHCFPSGHAVSAFGLLPLWSYWRQHQVRRARAWCAAAVLLGMVFGAAQVARGAHFVSHVLWSGWTCWAFALAWTALVEARPWRQPIRRWRSA